MQLFANVTPRTMKWLAFLGVVLTLIVAGTRGADLLRLRQEVRVQREELERARLVAAIRHPLAESETLSYDDVGVAGDPLPPAVIEKLKENYRLPNEEEPAKNENPPQTTGKQQPENQAAPSQKRPDAKKSPSPEEKKKKNDKPEAKKKKLLTSATVAQLRSTIGVDERTARFIVANANVRSWEELAARRRQLFEENEDAIEPLIVARVSKFAAESGIEKIDQFKVEPPKANVRRVRATANRTPTNAKTKTSPTPTASKTSATDVNAKLDAVQEKLRANDVDALLTALDDLVNAAYGDDSTERTARARLEELMDKQHLSPLQKAPLRLAAIRLQPAAQFVTTHLVEAYATRALKRFDDKGEGPVEYVEEPFPPLVRLPRPVQRRLLEALSRNGGAWFTDAQVKDLLGAAPENKSNTPTTEKSKGTPSQKSSASKNPTKNATSDSTPEDVTPTGTDETKLRAFHAELVDLLWRVAKLAQGAKNVEPNVYSATLLFKCTMEQLVNFIYKLENDVRWLRVNGLRIAVEQPDEPRLGVTLNLEALVLIPTTKAGM